MSKKSFSGHTNVKMATDPPKDFLLICSIFDILPTCRQLRKWNRKAGIAWKSRNK